MAKPFRLQPLIDLAEERCETAAQRLARLRLAWQEADAKCQQLERYLDEYRERLQVQVATGCSVTLWRDYQAFITKLETAIKVQRQEVERARQRWEDGQADWRERERELKAYEALRARHEEAERKRDEKIDQHVQDEFARNRHRRNREDSD